MRRRGKAHPEFAGKTAAVLLGFSGEGTYYLLEPTDPRSGLFMSPGLKLPPRTREISREQVRLLNEDLIVVTGATRSDFEKDSLVRHLVAFKDDRVAHFGDFRRG